MDGKIGGVGDVDAVARQRPVRVDEDGRIAGRSRDDPEEIVGRHPEQDSVRASMTLGDGPEHDRRADPRGT